MLAVSLLCSCQEQRAGAVAITPPSAAPTAPAVRTPTLRVEIRRVNAREYRAFVPGRARFTLGVQRPSEADAGVLLCVAGTYTSPTDQVEGVVLLEGKAIQVTPQAWQGLLVIEQGAARVERASDDAFSSARLANYEKRGVSLVQGHLLVDAGRATALKTSPALHRRAIVTGLAQPSFVVESLEPVELATFAEDLAALGAEAALNLDMGAWSEGWYRDEHGALVRLGHDRSSTARQSNWLILRGVAGSGN